MPIQYGGPVIDYDYSPDRCFTMWSLDRAYNVNAVPRTYKQAMLSDERPQWTGATQKEYVKLVQNFNRQIANEYTMKDLGTLKFFLGIEFLQEKGLVQMSRSTAKVSLRDLV